MFAVMAHWQDGDLHHAFEQLLDALLAELSPGWVVPASPKDANSTPGYLAYERRNVKRMQVASVLRAQPQLAVAVADTVLDAIVCDEDVSFNRQLIEPLLDAVGRRTVQEHLISVASSGSLLHRVCSVRAWYWSQPVLVYNSSQALRDGRPTAASKAEDDEVAGLRTRYRAACLTAFVDHDHTPTREWLASGFILNASDYPQELTVTVATARAIAEEDPIRFKALLAKTTDGTKLAAIRRDAR
jgi:hypothetical protein